jgi:hypothetical protein
MNSLRISFFLIFTKIFFELFVKGKSRYRKINFLTTSALLNCIIWVKGEGALKNDVQIHRVVRSLRFKNIKKGRPKAAF